MYLRDPETDEMVLVKSVSCPSTIVVPMVEGYLILRPDRQRRPFLPKAKGWMYELAQELAQFWGDVDRI